jgi:D-serine deaminase-like pyridoxal phosphate-dependent protein
MTLFDAGIRSLMLTAPVASPAKIDALARTAAAGAELSVVADWADLVDAFGAAARSRDRHARGPRGCHATLAGDYVQSIAWRTLR